MYYRFIVVCTIIFITFAANGFAEQQNTSENLTNIESKALKGKILETIDAGEYSYLQLDTTDGQFWAAIPKTELEKGQEVELMPGAVMSDFPSKTLKKTFETIIFSPGVKTNQGDYQNNPKIIDQSNPTDKSFEAALQAESNSNSQVEGTQVNNSLKSGGSTSAIVPAIDTKIEKAEGENSYTVAELFKKSSELDNKKVKVRGKVVKVSKMIMGKNWIHIQDGTGDAMNNSHDLVVTTMAEPQKDSIIIVDGVLHKDKDFGYNYKYAVIIEDAFIK